MDAAGRLTPLNNQKGLALVYTAILMLVFCAFLGLAIDVGYMYVTRGQLQNAADSAALAGASRLSGFANQTGARNEAVRFASKNLAATKDVEISSDGTNVLSASNDVTVGNWNPTASPRYSVDRAPINAVQVRARRTGSADAGGSSIGGPVDLFFAKVVAPSWAQVGTLTGAIAQRAPKAGFYIMLGNDTCDPAHTGEQILSSKNDNMAWTSLLDSSTNASDVLKDFICPKSKLPDVDVCGESIYTTNGIDNSLFKGVENDFYDPEYDRVNKAYAEDGSVSTWTVIVPVSEKDNPSAQPAPQAVWGYARIVISRACGSGDGNACSGITAPKHVCDGGETEIVISSITCVACSESSAMTGARPSLVQ